MVTPTAEQKLRMVRGEQVDGWGYEFEVPPVVHNRWSDHDWVRHVDTAGRWFQRSYALDSLAVVADRCESAE